MDDYMNIKRIIIDGQLVELSDGVGQSMTGKTVNPTYDTSVTAGEGAEIFNDYRERTYNSYNVALSGNVASGSYSHAEGYHTTAVGNNSHAEGVNVRASGTSSHAEGGSTEASGISSHAEGSFTIASGDQSHVEGYYAVASGEYSHAEGYRATASARTSHAEGYKCEASGNTSHAEGDNTTASGDYSHAEGSLTTASGDYSHAEGSGTIASDDYSHVEGSECKASKVYSHAEGRKCEASGSASHAEGNSTTASNTSSHAEGSTTTASGMSSHAEGSSTTASGSHSHAEGSSTTASGAYSHAEGYDSIASGSWSHTGGYKSTASGAISFSYGYSTIAHSREFAIGLFNVDSGSTDSDTNATTASLFVVGKGSNVSSRSNIFRITSSKIMGSTSFSSSGADYAEMFEWEDENPDNEDRCGRFVTIRNDKISLASSIDQFILGIISGNPTMIGDSHEDQWCSMYETDIFGRPIYEEVEVPARVDDEGNIITPEHKEMQRKVNPNYNNMEKYIGRQDRPEWGIVGLMGKLVMIDDGTCQPDQFCKPSIDGIATYSDEKTKYYVLKRLDENHIKVLIL